MIPKTPTETAARGLAAPNTRAFVALVAALAIAPPAWAEADLGLGAATFAESCANCHGAEGRGDGPRAAMLTVEVPDLTTLAARNGGTYDLIRVIYTMDGRAGLAAHGGPMPMFGGLLTGPAAVIDAPDGTPVATTEPILAIARWLETVQETP